MAEVKFKTGDKVVITGASYHHFNDGSEGTFVENNWYNVLGTDHKAQVKGEIKQRVFEQHLKLKTEKNMRQEMKNAVEKVANYLMGRDGNITTLPLKAELRKQYPAILWNQYKTGVVDGVSDMFHELVREGKFKSIGDNGTFQTYVPTSVSNIRTGAKLGKAIAKSAATQVGTSKQKIKTRGLVKGSATALAAGAKAAATRAANRGTTAKNVISRTQALLLMQDNKGHFFTAEFRKQDNSVRKLNGQYVPGQKVNGLGYVLVKEASKMKSGVNPIRNVNMQTLSALKIGGIQYQVK